MSMQKKQILRIDVQEDEHIHVTIQAFNYTATTIKEYIKFVILDLEKILEMNEGEYNHDNNRTDH